MNTDEMHKVKRIIDKCMEVNRKGKAEVFFQFSPHVDLLTISIHSPNWKSDKEGVRMEYFYPNFNQGNGLEEIEETLDRYM